MTTSTTITKLWKLSDARSLLLEAERSIMRSKDAEAMKLLEATVATLSEVAVAKG